MGGVSCPAKRDYNPAKRGVYFNILLFEKFLEAVYVTHNAPYLLLEIVRDA